MLRLNSRLGPVLFLFAGLALMAIPSVRAYVLETDQGTGFPLVGWPKGTAASPTHVPMQLHMQVGPPAFPSSPLQDGSTSWNQVVQAAQADWNQYLSTILYTSISPATDAIPTTSNYTNHNDVFWSSSIYGDSWGTSGDTLGITILWYDNNRVMIETDILFNNTGGINWDSYRGNLQFSPVSKTDLRRIALHELGHALGLDHPDQAGQTVAAIMNSVESNTDDLTPDDIAGAKYLYGSGPAITTQPTNQTVAQNSPVTFSVTPSGSGPFTYQWQKNGVNISGATGSSLTISSAQVTDAGNYTVIISNSGGSTTSSTAVLTVTAPAVITVQPVSQTGVARGFSVVFSVAATGSPAPTFQWRKNGTPISGATDPIYFIAIAANSDVASYTCTVSNSTGAVTSNAVTLGTLVSGNPGYLTNLSARANVGTGSNILIGGFAVGGSGSKQLLIRGAGPALSAFFGSASLATPQLTILNTGGSVIASNTAWASAPTAGPSVASFSPMHAASATFMNNLGAYQYQAGSLDTALVATAPTGNATTQISGVGGATGIALVEFYDGDAGPPPARLVNISARANVGTGNNILIGGFAIGGTAAETVMIRAIGPTLGDPAIGLTGVLAQPVLTLFQGGTVLYSNTGWGGDAAIASLFNTIGAYNPLDSGNQDSILLVTLPPGNYTAQVSGLNNGTGIALCEVYDVP